MSGEQVEMLRSEMGGDWAWVGPLVAAIGPTAFAFLLVATVLGYFYRRDILRKTSDLKGDRLVLIDVLVKNAESQSALAQALDRNTQSNERQIMTIVRAFEQRGGR